VSGVPAAIWSESLKARRSKVPWATLVAFSLAPLVGGLFMVILKDPQQARRLGLLGTKAQLGAASADWPIFLGLLAQSIAVGGGVIFAFLTAWVFGREFADRTIRNLLATPTPRRAIVTAKAIVVASWCGVSTLWVVVLGLIVGGVVGLPGWSAETTLQMVSTMFVVALLLILLQSTTAFFAGAGRGYIVPLAWAVFTIFVAQVVSVLGWGAWFPWAVPALLSGAAGPEGETLTVGSFIVVAVVAAIGFAATVVWWERADQTG
jgi:ABC-2 type transport system permease protein